MAKTKTPLLIKCSSLYSTWSNLEARNNFTCAGQLRVEIDIQPESVLEICDFVVGRMNQSERCGARRRLAPRFLLMMHPSAGRPSVRPSAPGKWLGRVMDEGVTAGVCWPSARGDLFRGASLKWILTRHRCAANKPHQMQFYSLALRPRLFVSLASGREEMQIFSLPPYTT